MTACAVRWMGIAVDAELIVVLFRLRQREPVPHLVESAVAELEESTIVL
jgi:hypothetical protein